MVVVIKILVIDVIEVVIVHSSFFHRVQACQRQFQLHRGLGMDTGRNRTTAQPPFYAGGQWVPKQGEGTEGCYMWLADDGAANPYHMFEWKRRW